MCRLRHSYPDSRFPAIFSYPRAARYASRAGHAGRNRAAGRRLRRSPTRSWSLSSATAPAFEQPHFADDLATQLAERDARRLLDGRTDSAAPRCSTKAPSPPPCDSITPRCGWPPLPSPPSTAPPPAPRSPSNWPAPNLVARARHLRRTRHQRRGAGARARRKAAANGVGDRRPVGRRRTLQGDAGLARDRVAAAIRVAAIGLYGSRLKVGCGSLGGWDPFGPERQITALRRQRALRARRPVRAGALQALPRRSRRRTCRPRACCFRCRCARATSARRWCARSCRSTKPIRA